MILSSELKNAMYIAKKAGEVVMEYYDKKYEMHQKEDASPVSEADVSADKIIRNFLKERYTFAILSEESNDDPKRLSSEKVWIVDPLDGTKDFIHKTGDFSIMIGCVVKNTPSLGVVYKPLNDVTYFAEKDKGAYKKIKNKKEQKIHTQRKEKGYELRVITSRFHSNEHEKKLEAMLGIKKRIISGSIGLKLGCIAEDVADLYVSISNKTSEWDTCAPEMIVNEAGGRVSDLYGRPLAYNQKDVKRRNGVIASSGGPLHDIVVEAAKNIIGKIKL